MSEKSNYVEGLLQAWYRGTPFPSPPSGLWVGLFNGNPTDTGSGGTEVTTQIRAGGRVQATFGTPTVTAGPNVMSNSSAVNYGNAANAVAQVTHFGVFDQQSGGNMLWRGQLAGQPIAVAQGDLVNFPIGALTQSED